MCLALSFVKTAVYQFVSRVGGGGGGHDQQTTYLLPLTVTGVCKLNHKLAASFTLKCFATASLLLAVLLSISMFLNVLSFQYYYCFICFMMHVMYCS